MARGLPSISVALLMAALVSEQFLADLDIGPFSPRVYLLSGLLVALLVRALRSGERVLRTRHASRLLSIHLAIVLWLGIAIPSSLAQWFDEATRLISGMGLL